MRPREQPPKLFVQSAVLMGDVAYNHKSAYYNGPWADSGKPVDKRYLGLRFLIKGKVHFGWARLNVRIYRSAKPTATAVLTGYAYETIPNKPIIAGKTKGPEDLSSIEEPNPVAFPTPTPVTLGTLAIGAPGLSIWRREESVGAAQ